MRTTLAICAVAGLASVAAAQTTVNSVAVQTGTIMPTGPRAPVNGDRFFNIESISNGTFASYGVARWDLSQAKASLDASMGAGNWHITKIEMELTQDNAAFSAAIPVNVYYSPDDITDAKTPASPLFYPFFDPVGGTPDLLLGNSGNPVLQYNFVVIGTGAIDRYTVVAPADAPTSDMALHAAAGQFLTMVFVEGGPTGAATYRGQEAFAPRIGPNLFITAEVNAPATCYGNCDNSTTLPVLNANDFNCFLNAYASGLSYANCDNSTTTPVLNANDFNCFLNAYAAGCS